MKKHRIISSILAVAALTFSSGCSKEPVVDAKVNDPPSKVEEAPDPNLVSIDHAELFTMVPVEMRQTQSELSVNGVVAPDVNRNVPVNVLTAGRVTDLRVRLGDYVKKGQLLLTMTSHDMSGAISDYQKFQADARLVKTQLERSQLLFSKGAIAQKDVQVAEDADQKARVDVSTSAERIKILGGDINRLSPLIEVRAPVSGTIIEQNVVAASGIKSLDNSPNLLTIADLSHVWVLCDVYENNLSQVHLGDRASLRLNAYPERKLEGRVSNIASLLDPATRTAKVRIDLPNPNGLMRPNMFASVVFTARGTQSRMTVPVSAILRLQDRDWVFVKQGPKRFRRTEVQALPATAGYQQVLAGVQVGDSVVANALQFSRAIENQQESAK
ncbi:MAG: efflux RND transporter periplasmic adaptor subunit [Acidobacteriota bacterium]|nr:efflux RND transporter periplasmic adaptor subunit [Acidobacteriota bacterium]